MYYLLSIYMIFVALLMSFIVIDFFVFLIKEIFEL